VQLAEGESIKQQPQQQMHSWNTTSGHTQVVAALLACCRRLLLCPKGLHNGKDYVSVFLDSPEAAWVPDHLNPTATFKLWLINQAGKGADFQKGGWGSGGSTGVLETARAVVMLSRGSWECGSWEGGEQQQLGLGSGCRNDERQQHRETGAAGQQWGCQIKGGGGRGEEGGTSIAAIVPSVGVGCLFPALSIGRFGSRYTSWLCTATQTASHTQMRLEVGGELSPHCHSSGCNHCE